MLISLSNNTENDFVRHKHTQFWPDSSHSQCNIQEAVCLYNEPVVRNDIATDKEATASLTV